MCKEMLVIPVNREGGQEKKNLKKWATGTRGCWAAPPPQKKKSKKGSSLPLQKKVMTSFPSLD
jgi:hypothetical protein